MQGNKLMFQIKFASADKYPFVDLVILDVARRWPGRGKLLRGNQVYGQMLNPHHCIERRCTTSLLAIRHEKEHQPTTINGEKQVLLRILLFIRK
jgi:hypothetical protein